MRETLGMLRRTLARLDVSSRSLFAVIERGSCFAGTLLELALAADRSYMLEAEDGPAIAVSAVNFAPFTMVNGLTRLAARFNGDSSALDRITAQNGKMLDARTAFDLGLVTVTPDELDWEDEIRLAVEERASLSPDASRPGRIGSSTGPTRSASMALSNSSGPAARRNSIGNGFEPMSEKAVHRRDKRKNLIHHKGHEGHEEDSMARSAEIKNLRVLRGSSLPSLLRATVVHPFPARSDMSLRRG